MPKNKLNPRQLRNLMVTILLSFVVAFPVLCQPFGLSGLLDGQTAADVQDIDIQSTNINLLAVPEAQNYVDQAVNRSLDENLSPNLIDPLDAAPEILDGEDELAPADEAVDAEVDLDALAAEVGEVIDVEAIAGPIYTAADYILYISANQLNLRSEPSTEAPVLAELKFGDKVACIGENAEWMQVTINDLTGYVKTEYTSKSMVFKEVSQTVYVSSSKLNLRQEPTTGSGIITSLTYMTKLTCTGVGDGWSRVKTATGKTGYVASQYLTTKAVSTGTSTAASTGTKTAAANRSGNIIVDSAYSALGVRYVSGGSSMSGFDCSGLTSWCYRQAGITISRSAASYYSVGTAVSYSNIQPGDILCLDTRRSDGRTSITHVAIYVGNGMMIHASSTNHRVVLQNVSQYLSWGVKLLSVRRVPN